MSTNALITINKQAIVDNYQTIKKTVGRNVKVAGMVKANAYGVDAKEIFNLLYSQGVRDFFVATLDEALEVKNFSKNQDTHIYILQDFSANNCDIIIENNLIPVLNTINNVYEWISRKTNTPCVIHFDSGIHRLGMSEKDIQQLKDEGVLDNLNIAYVVSHFSSSEDSDSKYTEEQFSRFEQVMKLFPEGTKKSISNSAGIFNNPRYHLDLVRPGAALYGINPTPGKTNPLKNAIELQARVLQVKPVSKGDKIGYNETYIMPKDGTIAIIGAGYADSIFRSHSNRAFVYFGDTKLPIIGRVSMDITTIDVSEISDEIKEGDLVEVLGPHQDLDAFGESGGTSGYEILTSLSKRYIWKYK